MPGRVCWDSSGVRAGKDGTENADVLMGPRRASPPVQVTFDGRFQSGTERSKQKYRLSGASRSTTDAKARLMGLFWEASEGLL